MWSKPTAPLSSSPPNAEPLSPTTAVKQRNPGKRFAQIVKLKPEFIDKYKDVHAAVWPEVLKEIKNCNIVDYSIFHDEESGILFATFKYVGYDYAGDMERMKDNPRVREWWKMTDGWQESLVPGATSSESADGPPWWKAIPEVFYTP